ncbi:MAG: hypothetical protein ABW166_03325 [Sedimenticola sp.]
MPTKDEKIGTLMSRLAITLILLLTTLSLSTVGIAQNGDRAQLRNTLLSEFERQLIRDYFHSNPDTSNKPYAKKKRGKGKVKGKKSKGLPPGLAKRKKLPPGLAKQLERNGHLPPGLDKRDLPNNLERMLPAPSSGQQRVVVDRDVLLIEEASGLILDILKDAL